MSLRRLTLLPVLPMVCTGLINLLHRGSGVALAALALTACDPGPTLPLVDGFFVRRLTGRQAARPWPVVIRGRRLATSTRHPLRFELLRLKPAWPRVRVGLEKMRRVDGRWRGQMPAGIPPGRYGLAVYRGPRGRLTKHRLRIWAPSDNVGYPVLSSVGSRWAAAGEGGRLVITGANLLQPAMVTLHGPQRRSKRAVTQGTTRMTGRKVQIPFKPVYRRMRITELAHPRQATPNRVVASLPRNLAPGRYYVQVYTATHRGNKPDVTVVVGNPLSDGQRLWGAVALGLALLLGLVWSVLLGRPFSRHRRRLGLLFGVLLACATPLLLLL